MDVEGEGSAGAGAEGEEGADEGEEEEEDEQLVAAAGLPSPTVAADDAAPAERLWGNNKRAISMAEQTRLYASGRAEHPS